MGQLLFHPVGQSYSPRSIHPSHQAPPSLYLPHLERQVLQAPYGPTWERIGFSGMGGDCNVPTPGWFARPHKISQLSSAHRARQAPHAEAQYLRARGSPVQQEKAIPLGIVHCIVAAAARSYNPISHHISDLVTIGFYFCKVHRPPTDGPIPAPHGIRVLHQGLSPPKGRPRRSFLLFHTNCYHHRQSE